MRKLGIVSVVLALLAFGGCAVRDRGACESDGKAYCVTDGIFRGEWDDYYELGLSCMEGGCYAEALSAFGEAIKEKDGDQRLERTYGMHLINYFPHRESGVILYQRGDLESAKAELEMSLSQTPSHKAHHYLDRVREAILRRENKDAAKPDVRFKIGDAEFETPGEILTKDDPVVISGQAEDDNLISEVDIAGFIESASETVAFETKLKLVQGTHDISIRVQNLLGGMTEHRVVLHVDRFGPVVTVDRFDPGTGITGSLSDDSGEMTLMADGIPVPILNGKHVEFTVPVKPDQKSVRLLAKDVLGNQTIVDASGDMTGNDIHAWIAENEQPLADTQPFLLGTKRNPERKPEEAIVWLKGWSEHQTVYVDRVTIGGRVRGNHAFSMITVNGAKVNSRAGPDISFTHSLELKPGENIVHIKAVDEFGKTTEKEVRITRKIPEAFQLKHRYGFSMYPFMNDEEAPGPLQRLLGFGGAGRDHGLFHYFLLKSLTEQGRFRTIVREKLRKIIEKQDVDLAPVKSRLFPEKNAKPPRATLVGHFAETREGIEITFRLVDIQTSEVLYFDIFGVSKDRDALKKLAENIALKMERKFPLCFAEITEIKDNLMIVSSDIRNENSGWPVLFYRKEALVNNGGNGEDLGSDAKILGYGKIEQLMKNGIGVKPSNGQEKTIRSGDWIIFE